MAQTRLMSRVEFAEIYNSCSSYPEFCQRTGYKLRTAQLTACKLRRMGLTLKYYTVKATAEELQLMAIRRGFMERCTYEKGRSYPIYGGAGIKTCQEWMESREAFIQWAMANGYKLGLQLDRIDSAGDYCPENCRWATPSQQVINTRKTRRAGVTSQYKGVSLNGHNGKWRLMVGRAGTKRERGYFDSEIEAAREYDRIALIEFGEYARLNFPKEQPPPVGD